MVARVVDPGHYTPDTTVEVYSWPTEARDVTQPDGTIVQREVPGDPPEGWRVLTSEGTDQQTAVKLADNGRDFQRDKAGEAVSLAPGQSIVLDRAGNIVQRLTSDADFDEFRSRHDAQQADTPEPAPADTPADTPADAPADTAA